MVLGANVRRGLVPLHWEGFHGEAPATDEGLKGALEHGPKRGVDDDGEVRVGKDEAGRGADAFSKRGCEGGRGFVGDEAGGMEEGNAWDAGYHEGDGAWGVSMWVGLREIGTRFLDGWKTHRL